MKSLISFKKYKTFFRKSESSGLKKKYKVFFRKLETLKLEKSFFVFFGNWKPWSWTKKVDKNKNYASVTPINRAFQKRVFKKNKMTANISKKHKFSKINRIGKSNIGEVEK